ncbi:Type-1 restriction enzyme EcoKI specificity protein [uncultured bacterium]|nr:Type-1 restriction enzyme EcoKI specificity protein [uncultured bacterium]
MNKVVLGNVCEKIGSGATPRGGSDVYLSQGEIALIRSQNVYNDGFKKDGLAYITEVHAEELSNVTVEPNDVLLNITGDSVARCCQVPDDILPARVNQHVAIIRPQKDKLDARYLRYYLVDPIMQDYMLMLAGGGATRNALTKGMIGSFEIPAPSVPEQRAIAGILGALDDKIELNRHMNRTLESIARAVFRQWFVESEDVGDWADKPLYEYAEYINGAAYRDFDFSPDNSGLPIIKIAEIKNGITNQTKYTNKQMDEKYRIINGDILFAWSGSPDTSIDTFIWVNGEGWLNQHIFKVIPPDPDKKWFTYLLLKHFKEIFIEIARDKQTTGLGHVTVKDLSRLVFTYPPDKVVAKFSEIVDPMMERIFTNEKESRTLASLRDSLLPKLMRGEVRVRGT